MLDYKNAGEVRVNVLSISVRTSLPIAAVYSICTPKSMLLWAGQTSTYLKKKLWVQYYCTGK